MGQQNEITTTSTNGLNSPRNPFEIQSMFSRIAPRYDLLNRLMTFGMDRIWRKDMVRILPFNQEKLRFLDLATGTGDVAFAIFKEWENRTLTYKEHYPQIDALDFSLPMIVRAKEKAKKKQLDHHLHFHCIPLEEMPFSENTFDGATIAFGIRNVRDPKRGLMKIFKVLKPKAPLIILEALPPNNILKRLIQRMHMDLTVRLLGNLLSEGQAYRYLGNSVGNFPQAKDFLNQMEEEGFQNCQYKSLSGGAVALLWGYK